MGKPVLLYSRVPKAKLASAVGWTLAVALANSGIARAADQEAAPQTSGSTGSPTTLETVSVLGSRGQPRSVASSAVPIDIITGEEFRNQGATDVLDQLRVLVPSFNVSTIPIDDAASLIRPANLRGLPPDNTLVLVNGKRFHRSAVITFLGHGLSDGSQGPDLSVFPSLALDQVEVLRDGAAAQYGSGRDCRRDQLQSQASRPRWHCRSIRRPVLPGRWLDHAVLGADRPAIDRERFCNVDRRVARGRRHLAQRAARRCGGGYRRGLSRRA